MTLQIRASTPFTALPIAANALHSATVLAVPQQRTLTLVVPCYNEEKRLDCEAFLSFVRRHPGVHLLFVNDGSKDRTLEVLKDLRARAPHGIDVLDMPKNGGKAEAVRQGMLFAVDQGAELTGYWDADLATPLEAIPDFVRIVDRLSSVDVVFGSRCRMLGHRINRTIKRRVISGLCATLARMALRLPIRDTQCGAKVFRTTPAFCSAISAPFTAGWLFDVELFGRVANGTSAPRDAFYELPLSEWADIAGSKVSGRAVINSGFRMLGLIAENRLGLKIAARRTADSVASPDRVSGRSIQLVR
jgi:glycosyltransferase involved in cell wall biosynthesis